MAKSSALILLLLCLVLCTQTLGQRPPRGRRRNMERRLAALEAKCDYSKGEQQAARLVAKMEAKIQTKLEAMQDGMQRLEVLLKIVEVKVSPPDKHLQDNDLSVGSGHNASVLAMEGIAHSMTRLVATSEQNLMSNMENTTKLLYENIATTMNDMKAHLLARAENTIALVNASIAGVEQTTKKLTIQVSAMEVEVQSVTKRMAASERSLKSTIRNAAENLASTMNVTKAQLLDKTESTAAVFSASIARVEQTTKELATRMSAVEVEVKSVTERMAASEQSLKSTIRNATENFAYTMNVLKAQFLAKAESNAAVFSASIARVGQTTKELVTRVSAVEEKLDDATSLYAEEIKKTRTSYEAIQKQITDVKNHTTEVNGPLHYIRSCQTYYKEGLRTSGVYRLQLQDGHGPMEVFCDMSKGAGWVVFQRRLDGSVDFYRNWTSYEEGFGDLSGEFWLGNRNIHRLTSAGLIQLRVDLQTWNGSRAFASYSHFSVGDASTSYKLTVCGYSGTTGDSLAAHNGHRFSTYDRDEDTHSSNCAQYWKGAWWYHGGCHNSNLNGQYGTRDSSGNQYVIWHYWFGIQSLQHTELKLK